MQTERRVAANPQTITHNQYCWSQVMVRHLITAMALVIIHTAKATFEIVLLIGHMLKNG